MRGKFGIAPWHGRLLKRMPPFWNIDSSPDCLKGHHRPAFGKRRGQLLPSALWSVFGWQRGQSSSFGRAAVAWITDFGPNFYSSFLVNLGFCPFKGLFPMTFLHGEDWRIDFEGIYEFVVWGSLKLFFWERLKLIRIIPRNQSSNLRRKGKRCGGRDGFAGAPTSRSVSWYSLG